MPAPRHSLRKLTQLHLLLASDAGWPPSPVPPQRNKVKNEQALAGSGVAAYEYEKSDCGSRPLRAVGGGVTRPTAAQRLRPRPTCGEITRHHSLANASETSCVTPSMIDSSSPGKPFSLPRHMAPAECRKPGMPGNRMGKFRTWQKSANKRSTTLVTNTVTNTDSCHGTSLRTTALSRFPACGGWRSSRGADTVQLNPTSAGTSAMPHRQRVFSVCSTRNRRARQAQNP